MAFYCMARFFLRHLIDSSSLSLSLCLIYNRQINEAYFLTIRILDSDFTIILIGSIHRHAGLLINNLQRFVVLRVLRDCWIRQRYEGRRDIGRGIKPCSHQKMLSMTRGTPSTSLIGLHVWFDVGWPKWKRHPAPEEDSNRKVNRNGGRWWKDRMEVNKKIIPFFLCSGSHPNGIRPNNWSPGQICPAVMISRNKVGSKIPLVCSRILSFVLPPTLRLASSFVDSFHFVLLPYREGVVSRFTSQDRYVAES